MLLKAMFNPLGVAREMDRLFDTMVATQPLGFVPTVRPQTPHPAVNVWEDEERIYAEAELPGMSMDEVEVLVTDDQLTIRGTREIRPPAESNALRRERITGAFERSIQLPAQIDIERGEARLNQGVLMITLPKAAVCMPRKIKVNALPDDS